MKAATGDSSQTLSTTPAEDEALKRNTDCVYFLASPLTCKKGIECEYRHSEDARMNPRDCWYWLNGNCLNPKCSFRHPPLDGLLGTGASTTTSARPSLPPSQTAAIQLPTAAVTSSHNLAKQGTPCYYYQNGLCLKGDRCPFVHASQPADNLPQQIPIPKVTAPFTEPQTFKKTLGGLEKCTQHKKILPNIIKPVEVLPQAKPPIKSAPTSNGIAIERTMPPAIPFSNELLRYKPTQVPPVISGNSVSRNHRSHQTPPMDDRRFRNGKEADEFLGESSPGFDVLVDDDLRDSDYYQNEDEFLRVTSHVGKHMNSMSEFDYDRPTDYNSSLGKFDREMFNDDPHGYERYGRVQDQYAREPRRDQRRGSSERISERPSVPEWRGHPRAESPDRVNESDLRYRLSKQRKVNGSRSVVSPDRHGDFYRREDRGRYIEDQKHRGHPRRDSRHLPQESSISHRLQGRISLLGRSSPDGNQNDSHREREMDRGRNWDRLSPSRPPSSYRGKSQDGIKRRVQEDFITEGRTYRGPLIRRDDSDSETSNFAAPKRLAELKGAKVSESSEAWQTKGKQIPSGDWKNMKIGKLPGHQELDGSCSFEGPKPLSEILKRKREEKAVSSKEDNNKKRKGEVSKKPSDMPSENSIDKGLSTENVTYGSIYDDEEEGLIPAENYELTNEGQASAPKGTEHETDDMMLMDKMQDDDELETFDQREEESDYEQVDDGGDFNADPEDENVDPEDEYLDDEDDFAKKIGVMFS